MVLIQTALLYGARKGIDTMQGAFRLLLCLLQTRPSSRARQLYRISPKIIDGNRSRVYHNHHAGIAAVLQICKPQPRTLPCLSYRIRI